MKVRNDFVTNSSSSSYIVIYEVSFDESFHEYMKEEYGNYGAGLLMQYLKSGKSLIEDFNKKKAELQQKEETVDDDDVYDFGFRDVLTHIGIEDIDPNKCYLTAERIEWTNEGETEGDDAWLADHIPDEYKKEIYQSDAD